MTADLDGFGSRRDIISPLSYDATDGLTPEATDLRRVSASLVITRTDQHHVPSCVRITTKEYRNDYVPIHSF